MKHNTTILGYDSFNDFANTNFGISSIKLNIFLSIFGGLTSFITSYIYNDAAAVYFLVFLLFMDFVTGVCRAAILNRFSSARMPRIALTSILYLGLLAISWNLSKYAPIYDFLPGAIYAVFVGTLFKSLIENLKDIGLLPKGIYNAIMKVIKKKEKED